MSSSKKAYCCIRGCTSMPSRYNKLNTVVKFYLFPRSTLNSAWITHKRKQWINAVKDHVRYPKDWEPYKHTKICNAHFVNNEKSENPSDPSYLPTIFPVKENTKKSFYSLQRVEVTQQRTSRDDVANRVSSLLLPSAEKETVFVRPKTNAEKCNAYYYRKNNIIKKSCLSTNAERCQAYRLRKKNMAQGQQSSVNEILFAPLTSNSSPQPVITGSSLTTAVHDTFNCISVQAGVHMDNSQMPSGPPPQLMITGAETTIKNETVVIKDEPEQSNDDVPDKCSMYGDDDTSSVAAKENNDTDQHDEFQCDNCDRDIFGFRYTCVQCINFDLCCACESSGAHAQHYMLRVPGPRPYNEIQTLLAMMRKYLKKELNPTSKNDFDNEQTISLKSELKSEDEDIEMVTHQVNKPDEDTVDLESRQHSRLSSSGSINLENTDSKEAVQDANEERTQNPIQKATLSKSDTEPIESQVKFFIVKDINESSTAIVPTVNKYKIISANTAKWKSIIKTSVLEEIKGSNPLPKKICVLPSKSSRELTNKPIIITGKCVALNSTNTLLNKPLSAALKREPTASSNSVISKKQKQLAQT